MDELKAMQKSHAALVQRVADAAARVEEMKLLKDSAAPAASAWKQEDEVVTVNVNGKVTILLLLSCKNPELLVNKF